MRSLNAAVVKRGLNLFKEKGVKLLPCLFVVVTAALMPMNARAAFDIIAQPVSVAQIDIAHGKLTVKRPGVMKPFAIWAGSDINIGDVITTGDNAAARLSFADNSFVNMTGQTTIRVNQYIYESDKDAPERKRVLAIVRVLEGRARFVASMDPGVNCQIYVETGIATAAGSGDFVVTALPEATWIETLDSSVYVSNISNTIIGTVTLYPNQKTVVREKEPPEKPVYITLTERRALIKETIVR